MTDLDTHTETTSGGLKKRSTTTIAENRAEWRDEEVEIKEIVEK